MVCQQLAKRGHQVRVVTSDLDIAPSVNRDAWVNMDGFQVYYSRTQPWNRIPPYFIWSAKKALKESISDCDVVYMRVGLTMINRWAQTMSTIMNVPYVYNAEGGLCPERLKIKALSKWFFLRAIERPLMAKAACLHASTQKEVSDYHNQTPNAKNFEIIPNGVELPDLSERRLAKAWVAEEFGFLSTKIVLFLGRLDPMKGPNILLQAFARLVQFDDVHLVFAGSDWGAEAQLKARVAANTKIRDRVHFVGSVGGEEKHKLLLASDIFGLISQSEGLPNAVLEALAYGIPCLITPQCNVPQVQAFGAGICVNGDVDSVTIELNKVLSTPALWTSMKRSARQLAQTHFDINSVVEKIEHMLMRVATQQRDSLN